MKLSFSLGRNGVKTAQSSVSISAHASTAAISSHHFHLPLRSSIPSPQAASDINSPTRPQVHHHFAAIQPLKMTGLIVSNGLSPLWVKCQSYQWMSCCFAPRPAHHCSFCCCIWNHNHSHLAQQCNQQWSSFCVLSLMCDSFSLQQGLLLSLLVEKGGKQNE